MTAWGMMGPNSSADWEIIVKAQLTDSGFTKYELFPSEASIP